MRESLGKVQKARAEEAIAALQPEEEAPPAAAEEASTSSAQPPVPKHIARWKRPVAETGIKAIAKEAMRAVLPMEKMISGPEMTNNLQSKRQGHSLQDLRQAMRI